MTRPDPVPPMSMTAFASGRGGLPDPAGAEWSWEIRSVNGRGLDLRLRLPEGIEGLEAALRAELSRRCRRGNISLTLRLTQATQGAPLRLNPTALTAALATLRRIEAAAAEAGLDLVPVRASDILNLRGIAETASADPDGEGADAAALRSALMSDFAGLLDEFTAMRASEGAALVAVVMAQIDEVARLTAAARTEAATRRDAAGSALRLAVARVLEAAGASDAADPARIAQELALLAVKADVAEELDRLDAHVAAARGLLGQGGPVGRKFDFLTQEFNREANTLCSKAQSAALTAIGLDLKHVIDQMREQIQNLE